MSQIHKTAIIEPGAQIGKNVEIGPYSIVGKHVKLGDNVKLKSHVVVENRTTIGENTIIYPFASIGHCPQDLKYSGEESELIIGKNNVIREHVTMNPGTAGDLMKTIVGDNCLFMMSSHVAHDCVVGNNVILANNATLGGHVKIGNFVILGGMSAIHQFTKIGDYSMIGGMSGVKYDVPPYTMIVAEDPYVAGINVVGLKRKNFSKQNIKEVQEAYDILFQSSQNMAESIKQIEQKFSNNESVEKILYFLKSESSRGICKPKNYYENIRS